MANKALTPPPAAPAAVPPPPAAANPAIAPVIVAPQPVVAQAEGKKNKDGLVAGAYLTPEQVADYHNQQRLAEGKAKAEGNED